LEKLLDSELLGICEERRWGEGTVRGGVGGIGVVSRSERGMVGRDGMSCGSGVSVCFPKTRVFSLEVDLEGFCLHYLPFRLSYRSPCSAFSAAVSLGC